MLKQMLLFITLLGCLVNLNAQEKNNIKLAIETGFLPLSSDSENLGLFLNIEPKVKIVENTFIGLRVGVTLNAQTFENEESFQFIIDEQQDHGVISFVPTVDYYLNTKSNYHPYVGLGVGLHLLSDIDVYETFTSPSEDFLVVMLNKQVGFLLRGGFELRKLRLGLEYNFIPKVDIEAPNGEKIGTVDNSYVGLSIGLIIGGGKNPK